MAIKLIVDTSSDIGVEKAEEMGIWVVPLTIEMGDKDLTDGYDISKDEFYETLEKTDIRPATGSYLLRHLDRI